MPQRNCHGVPPPDGQFFAIVRHDVGRPVIVIFEQAGIDLQK